MNYSELLKESITAVDLSLSQICRRLKAHGLNTNKTHLSKLQNGKLPPAGDKLNEALAKVLEIDPLDLKAAAYSEKIPADVLEHIFKKKSA
jgi:transcriptional regulator with XRE-family HTH domain